MFAISATDSSAWTLGPTWCGDYDYRNTPLFKRPAWIPASLANRQISKAVLQKSLNLADQIWLRLERLVHPRFLFLSRHKSFQVVNYILLVSLGFLLFLPLLIPFTNSTPALVILLNALGLIEEDGVLILISYLLALLVFAFFIALALQVRVLF